MTVINTLKKTQGKMYKKDKMEHVKGESVSKIYITYRDSPGGAVVKNPPANAGNTGSSPGPGRSHMPQSN